MDVSGTMTRATDPTRVPYLRARRLAAAVITVVVVLSCLERPAPGLSSDGLAVSLALLVLVAASAVLLMRPDSPLAAVALGGLVIACCCLTWLQRGGAAEPGLFVAVAVAGTSLADGPSLAALGLAAAVSLPSAIHAHRSAGMIAGTEMGIVAFYGVARLGRSAAAAHEQASRLLLELQANRDAEAEAAMLRERGRIARDVHDVLAHSLSGLMLQLEGARMLARQPDANGRLPLVLDRAHHLARAGVDEARRAISALRDEDLPGPDRLENLTTDFERDSMIRTSFEVVGPLRRLDSEASLTIYRVAQEALTNVRKHAAPDSVAVCLAYGDGGTSLTIRDLAARRSAAPAPQATGNGGGYGLTGMRERAELLGGSLRVRQLPDGFEVQLWIPA